MIAYRAYNRQRAVEYARRWALSRNPLFYNFTGIGGDCTNFVSQALLAGSCVMNYTPDFGWYYRSADDRAPAWTGVEYFWEYMTEAERFVEAGGNTGPFGREVGVADLDVGDVIQLSNSRGDYYHTLLVTGRAEDGDVLVAAHTDDALDRRLSSYTFDLARYLHILGVRYSVGGIGDCYLPMLEGRELLLRGEGEYLYEG